jgi:hypothetical protein
MKSHCQVFIFPSQVLDRPLLGVTTSIWVAKYQSLVQCHNVHETTEC